MKMKLWHFTVEWYPKGLRPNYRRDPFIYVMEDFRRGGWFSIWIGRHIRIGRT